MPGRSEALDRAYVDQGITFSLPARRVRALELFLADIYGDTANGATASCRAG